jgi:hypothetical protein
MKKDPTLYYPITVGTKWVYEDSKGGEVTTLTISKVETIKGAKVVTVEREGNSWEKMSVSENGLVRVEGAGGAVELDPPLIMLKAPFQVGTKWEIKTAGIEGTDTIGAIGEEVTVPAGTFKTVRVDSDYTLARERMQTVFWYAIGVGMVKWTHNKDTSRMLKSFSPGK